MEKHFISFNKNPIENIIEAFSNNSNLGIKKFSSLLE
jgi:hypothetical protein